MSEKNKNNIWHKAAEALKDNALQTTLPAPGEGCAHAGHSGCAGCSFKCAAYTGAASETDDPFKARNLVDPDVLPETTIPFPQIVVCIVGFILGVLLSRGFVTLFF